MRLFPKEDVVSQVLDDLGDDHETAAHDEAVVPRYFYVNDFRSYDRRRNEAAVYREPNIAMEKISTNRKKMKAPRAANFASGQTSLL
jgi:hypothetical protein